MKKSRYLQVCIIVTLAYTAILYLEYVHNSQEQRPLPEWIVGKWQGERKISDETGTHLEEIQLEFLPSGVLIYRSSLSRELEFGVVFKYNFNSNNQLALRGRLQDNWNLTRKGSHLFIEGGMWSDEGVTFERFLGYERTIVLVIGMLIMGILFYKPLNTKDLSNHQDTISSYSKLLRIASMLAIHVLVLIAGFKIGQLFVNATSTSNLLLYQGLPWYPIILLESFFVVLLLGLKIVIATSKSIHASLRVKYYLGIFLISSSLYGLFIGLVRLIALYFLPLVLT